VWNGSEASKRVSIFSFATNLVDLSVWHSRVHYSATRTSFATIFDVPESSIHRLSYAVPFMSIVVAVAEKSGGKVKTQSITI
jgi:hypothetical protein